MGLRSSPPSRKRLAIRKTRPRTYDDIARPANRGQPPKSYRSQCPSRNRGRYIRRRVTAIILMLQEGSWNDPIVRISLRENRSDAEDIGLNECSRPPAIPVPAGGGSPRRTRRGAIRDQAKRPTARHPPTAGAFDGTLPPQVVQVSLRLQKPTLHRMLTTAKGISAQWKRASSSRNL